MIRKRTLSAVVLTASLALFLCLNGRATFADNPADPAKAPPTDVAALAEQVKELQKQVADLRTRVGETQEPRIVAAGTATFKLGKVQDNATNAHVQLKEEIAAKIGDDYIVIVTNRFPSGGYPFFAPYWKTAKDGFDITLVDSNLGPNGSASYLFSVTKNYLIDWIVVKK